MLKLVDLDQNAHGQAGDQHLLDVELKAVLLSAAVLIGTDDRDDVKAAARVLEVSGGKLCAVHLLIEDGERCRRAILKGDGHAVGQTILEGIHHHIVQFRNRRSLRKRLSRNGDLIFLALSAADVVAYFDLHRIDTALIGDVVGEVAFAFLAVGDGRDGDLGDLPFAFHQHSDLAARNDARHIIRIKHSVTEVVVLVEIFAAVHARRIKRLDHLRRDLHVQSERVAGRGLGHITGEVVTDFDGKVIRATKVTVFGLLKQSDVQGRIEVVADQTLDGEEVAVLVKESAVGALPDLIVAVHPEGGPDHGAQFDIRKRQGDVHPLVAAHVVADLGGGQIDARFTVDGAGRAPFLNGEGKRFDIAAFAEGDHQLLRQAAPFKEGVVEESLFRRCGDSHGFIHSDVDRDPLVAALGVAHKQGQAFVDRAAIVVIDIDAAPKRLEFRGGAVSKDSGHRLVGTLGQAVKFTIGLDLQSPRDDIHAVHQDAGDGPILDV